MPADAAAPVLDRIRRDYDAMARRYEDFVRDPATVDALGMALLDVFAERVRAGGGPVLDAGCGPGHLTDRLDGHGLAVRGIDLSPAMIELAGSARPDLEFAVGSLLDLPYPDGTFGGVLAHFSTIHTPPKWVPKVFAQLARVLAPGGHLLIGFQTGDVPAPGWEAFDHTVTRAYRWSVDAIADLLAAQGLAEIIRLVVQPGARQRFPSGYLLVRADAPPVSPSTPV